MNERLVQDIKSSLVGRWYFSAHGVILHEAFKPFSLMERKGYFTRGFMGFTDWPDEHQRVCHHIQRSIDNGVEDMHLQERYHVVQC
jgi:hypothetical protein